MSEISVLASVLVSGHSAGNCGLGGEEDDVKNIGEDELMLRVPRWTGPEHQWSVRSSLTGE